ncbi:type II toxin-antitoxin system RelE/ParE family toxin [uncultured Duncaniella sp.]|uniref:type II toxin-antitoxin system RelE/ParE family toxin n=2 Tax=uncultured Duncaniella sp. TaxID=2768039 RepID=UPI0025DFC238|nr:type II toxin-antitoxin system RelE/ParE family toxin [uncultured Duncaniella sp.]
MDRRIITFGGHFERFMASLDLKVQRKIDYALDLLRTQDRISKKFVKALKEGLFELRSEWEGNIYRVFFIFDGDKIVVLFNGFQKKTQKTPENEIKKALRIKEEYYEQCK